MELKEFKEVYDSMVLPEKSDKKILNRIMQENFNGKKGNIMDKKGKTTVSKAWRIAAASLAAVLVAGAGVYAATQIWDNNVANEFNVADKPEKMKEMSEKGFSQYMKDVDKAKGDDNNVLSVTDKDITVDVVQTLADRHCIYVYFEAEFGDKYTPVTEGQTEVSDTGIAYPEVKFDTGDVTLNWSGGIAKIINNHKIAYEYYFETADLSQSLDDIEFEMNISKFTVDRVKCDPKPEVLAEGTWNFKWDLSHGTEKRIYTIDKKVNIQGFDFKLKTLEISPLSYYIVAEADGWNEKDLKRYKKLNAEDGINVVITGLELDDSVFKGFGGMGAMGTGESLEPVILTEFTQFDEILDLEQLKGIVFPEGQEVSLEDCSYSVAE